MPNTDVRSPAAPDAVSRDEQMLLLDQLADRPDPAADPAGLTVTVLDSLAAAEPFWRALEVRGVLTPYQRYDWVAAFAAARGPDSGSIAIAVVHHRGAPAALLPLLIRARFGIASATLLGAELGSIGWMPVLGTATAALTGAALRSIFAEIRRQTGRLDLIVLTSQPRTWLDLDNPLLALPHQPAPDRFYRGPLADGPNNKRLRNILRGRRRLEESFGPVILRHAETAEEIDAIHDVFLRQRGKRFAEQGIDNIFAEPWVVDFFRRTAGHALGAERPALRLHALYAGSEIVATSCGSYCGPHYSQYINSTTDGPAAKSSLMGLLMHELRAELTAEGIASIDMGLGDFDYKTDWTAPEAVYDAVVPLTGRGWLLAPPLRALRRLKRAIKQNEPLFDLLKRLRAMLRRTRSA